MVQQTPWIQRSFHFDFDAGLFPVIFSRLEGSIFRLHTLLSGADDEITAVRFEGWSVKEQVGHLADLESLWWSRLQDFRNGKEILTAADMSNKKTEEAGHNENQLEKVFASFSNERQKMLEEIYEFDEEMLLRSALHPRLNQPMRVIDSLYFVAEHDDHHISSISNLLRRPVG
jgi:uncharacterized damage-inducible protein DinB